MLTSWLKPPHSTSGEDHQATRAVCENLYARLLPGITNVTDRARYYTFYPWVIWQCHQRSIPADQFIPTLRAADCLFTLIGLAQRRDARALVGSGTLRAVLDAMPTRAARLSSHTHLEPAASRYFKNPRGGLGQYYLGSLELLKVLTRKGSTIQLTPERGIPLAEAVDAGVDGDAFFAALQADQLDLKTLTDLAAFSPDALPASTQEHALLLGLLFNNPGPMHATDTSAHRRRLTLGLLLNLTEALTALPSQADFRALIYTGARADGTPWSLPAPLEAQRERWAIYQRSDLLSVAMQGLFQAGLTRLAEAASGSIPSARHFGEFVRQQFFSALPDLTVADFIAASPLPERSAWSSPQHEIQLARAILRCTSRPDAQQQQLQASSALALLLALCARDDTARAPYGDELLTDSYLLPYPINLISLRARSREWMSMPVGELAAWLAHRWGVDVHLRVALRKLRQQSTDTFQIRPLEGHLQVKSVPPAVESVPRYRTARQILLDLGLLTVDSSGAVVLTSRGQQQRAEVENG